MLSNCTRLTVLSSILHAQGIGLSEAHGVAYSNGNIYMAGYAMGNLSFHTQHKDGSYTDHAGSSTVADSHTDVTVHHATGSFASGDFAEHATSQYGMDAIIYKVSQEGVPQMVFAADSLPADADTNPYAFHALNSDELGADGINNGSANGRSGPMVEIFDIDSFADQNDVVVVGGTFRGKLTFPGVNGDIVLVNTKAADRGSRYTAPHFNWDNQDCFVAKVDMSTGKALWATDAGLTVPVTSDRASSYDVATTKAGHVIHSFDERYEVSGSRAYTSQLTKFDGTAGTKLWEVEYTSVQPIASLDGDSTDEVVYVTGTLEGTDVDPFGTGTPLTATRGDAFVAALDVSGTSGPAANWVLQVGRGSGSTVEEQGEHLIVAGSISSEGVNAGTTIGTCSLTGDLGGFIMKLKKDDGACVWAKDTPAYRSAVSDGTSVWTFGSGDGKVPFGAGIDVWASDAESAEHCDGRCSDIVMGKYDASNGKGLWASALGGTGAESFGGAVMTPDGPVLVAESTSETIQFGGLTLSHLQHASPLIDAAVWGPNRRGPKAMFSMLISTTDVEPTCIDECPTGEVSAADTTIKTGQCYAYNECLANGAPSKPFPCFQCDAAADKKALSGQATKDPIAGYCYFDEKCKPAGTIRDEYQYRNEPSVCEWCDPTVDANDWSLRSGFVHDRTFALEVEDGQPRRSWGRRLQAGEAGQANEFGMLFEKESNGCQLMPAMAMPAAPSDDLTAALGDATSGDVADVAALASGAIAAVRSATSTNQHAEIAWAHYIGNSTTCTKAGDVCQHTPSAFADMMGTDFDTHLHYGDSVARVKVQQGLSMLIAALAKSFPASHIADLKKDVVAHMLIPYYQGAIKSAHRMDLGANAVAKATALAEGKVYWTVIDDAIGDDLVTADRAALTSVFASAAAGINLTYCEVSMRLHDNLPPASQLQYVNYVREGAMDTIAAASTVHTTAADVGTLQESLVGGEPKECKERTADPLCPVSPSCQTQVELEAQIAAERAQCAVDKSLNAASVLDKLKEGTIKLVFT